MYLDEFVHPDQLYGELFLAPNFQTPPNLDYAGCHDYINDFLPQENPHLYGLHPNAETGFLTAMSEKLFKTVFKLQPRESGTDGLRLPREEEVKTIVDDILEGKPEQFNMHEWNEEIIERIGSWFEGRTYNHLRYRRVVNALFFDQVDCTGYYIVSECCIKDTERCDSVKQCTDGNNNRNCS